MVLTNNGSTGEIPCFYLPKELINQEYSGFSTESKLLFSMVFTNAKHTKAIYEVARLIDRIDENELNEMREHLLSSGKED